MHQRGPRLRVLAHRLHQQHFHDARKADALPVQSRRKNFRIVQHQAVARVQELREVAERSDPPSAAPRDTAPASATPRDPPAAPARSTTRASDNEIAKGPNHTLPVQNSRASKHRAMKPRPPWWRTESRFALPWSPLRSRTAKYGGVVPELASREHLRAIVPGGAPGSRTSRHGSSTVWPPSRSPKARAWWVRCWSASPTRSRSASRATCRSSP